MCGSKPSRDNSAEIARREEAARQARIATGQESIDSAFSNFNDDFFSGYQNDYTNYYNPQLDDQFADANKKLTLRLAQSGNLTGSVGATQLADLQKYYDQQKLAITGNATSAVNDLRGSIDNRKSQLYADNRASADPGNAATAAASAAESLQPAPLSSPLANVFSNFFADIGDTAAVRNNTQFNSEGNGVQSFGSGGNRSVYNVN
jgi:hypothetical protein